MKPNEYKGAQHGEIKIHEAFNKTEVAFRYFQLIAPDKNYPREQARKQLIQDKKFNFGLMKKVIAQIKREQMEMLNKAKQEAI